MTTETKQSRVVTMTDGTIVDFGSRSKVLVTFSIENSTATFKICTGDIITWVISGMDNLTSFQKTVYMYGLVERVKCSLSPVSLEETAGTIKYQINEIEKGNFNIRGNGNTKVASLSQLQTAYAIAMSKIDGEKSHWLQVGETSVIADVLASWEAKDKKQRNAVRRHPAVSLELSIIKLSEGESDLLEA